MVDPRPRIAIPWPSSSAVAEILLDLLDGDLRDGPLDVVLVAPTGSPRLPQALAESPATLGASLASAREAGRGSCWLRDDRDPAGAARRLLEQGRVDALVLPQADPQAPVLWVRDGVRVVDACPGASLLRPLDLDPNRLADLLRRSGILLRELGRRRPRLALCDVEQAPTLRQAARAAQGPELEVLGPTPCEHAVRAGADALVGVLPPHVQLPLELLGSGPRTGFPLEETRPVAWPGEPGPLALLLTCSRVAALANRPYAVEREQAQRKLSVTARAERAPDSHGDRCPYCHRDLGEGELPGPAARCVTCGTGHHRDCIAEHGHCTVLGCPGVEVERLGVRFEVARLGPEDVSLASFEPLQGDTSSGPRSLRVEAPIDDPDTPTAGQPRLALQLASPRVRRGERVEGYVVVSSARPFSIRGGVLRLRSTLTTQQVAADGTRRIPRPQAILAREALCLGAGPAGTLGRLQDGVTALLGGGDARIEIPAGVRRWPFSFRLAPDHPPTVTNRFKDTEEAVATSIEVELDTDLARASLVVT